MYVEKFYKKWKRKSWGKKRNVRNIQIEKHKKSYTLLRIECRVAKRSNFYYFNRKNGCGLPMSMYYIKFDLCIYSIFETVYVFIIT